MLACFFLTQRIHTLGVGLLDQFTGMSHGQRRYGQAEEASYREGVCRIWSFAVCIKTMRSSWMNFFLSMYMLMMVLCTCAFEYTCVGVTVEARGQRWVSSPMVLQQLGGLANELQTSAFHHPMQHWGYTGLLLRGWGPKFSQRELFSLNLFASPETTHFPD